MWLADEGTAAVVTTRLTGPVCARLGVCGGDKEMIDTPDHRIAHSIMVSTSASDIQAHAERAGLSTRVDKTSGSRRMGEGRIVDSFDRI